VEIRAEQNCDFATPDLGAFLSETWCPYFPSKDVVGVEALLVLLVLLVSLVLPVLPGTAGVACRGRTVRWPWCCSGSARGSFHEV
jgi:hypothetical protein